MTQRPFIPPSHDNVVNARGVMMSSALNKVMSVQEQSYDEFLNSFMYLSKEDVQAHTDSINNTANSDLPSRHVILPSEETSASPRSNSKVNHDKGVKLHENTSVQSDDLEEEVLGEGMKTSIMSSTDISICAAGKLKFDNFVGSDDDEDGLSSHNDEVSPEFEDEFECGGYVASFGGVSVKPQHEDCVVIDSNTKEPKPLYGNNDEDEKTKRDNSDDESENAARVVDIYPGEVAETGDEPSIELLQNDRHLDFSAKHGSSLESSKTESTPESLTNETCTDEVEPFTLDENFDYDNVVLTPKFTANEMEFLKSLMEENKICGDEET